MPKIAQASELTLNARSAGVSIPNWLYKELRTDILSGRLIRGSRVPATRELARQHNVSRGTVVTAFEQLIGEGYLESRKGAGTFVCVRLPESFIQAAPKSISAVRGGPRTEPAAKPFRFYEPALRAFPMDIWARLASRRFRRASERMLAAGDAFGYGPLREAVADYLRRSRGVVCRT